MTAHDSPRFDSRELRNVLGAFVTGVTVVTTVDPDGTPFGLTANSFSSVSLNPPLILWSQSLSAPSYPVFRDAEHFAISILAEHQSDVSQAFARGGVDKFVGIATERGRLGMPLICGAAAHLECRRVSTYPGGDHAVFLGEIEHIRHTPDRPLAFGRGRYLITSPRDLGDFSLDLGISNLGHVHAVRLATPILADLAATLRETMGLVVWGNKGPTVIRWEESECPVSQNLRTGVVLPLLRSASGIAFAAFLPRALTEELITQEMSDANAPFRTMAEAEDVLSQAREGGIGQVAGSRDSFGEMYTDAISALSVPVFDASGTMVLALTVVGSGARFDIDRQGRLVPPLRRAAEALSKRLGYQG